MTATTDSGDTTQVYRIYIKASAEAIWEAITDPEWTNRYGYTGYAHYDLQPGGSYTVVANEEFKAAAETQGYPCPDVVIDGEVIEADPPHRLVTTWRMLMDPTCIAEGFTTITHEIKALDNGACLLTLTHKLDASHKAIANLVSGQNEARGEGGGGGHAWVLSDLKSLLETGSGLGG
ncbi:MAG TPA: SRPBCC domain-containing protein [Acidimicrobiales bacterium]|jgi:uncharacterized protein YndB with AHSA1/START domain|nr:SRPBCC domain-containing protein [Acidimicrobiales bacterium]